MSSLHVIQWPLHDVCLGLQTQLGVPTESGDATIMTPVHQNRQPAGCCSHIIPSSHNPSHIDICIQDSHWRLTLSVCRIGRWLRADTAAAEGTTAASTAKVLQVLHCGLVVLAALCTHM